jgi:hypothetical protein
MTSTRSRRHAQDLPQSRGSASCHYHSRGGPGFFLPAGTLGYWQAWLFMAVFFSCSLAITLYLARKDPELLQRRMRVGPSAEREPSQKLIMTVALLALAALPALDHRFGWSQLPPALVIFGDILIMLAYVGFYLVFRENTYGGATIELTPGQNGRDDRPLRRGSAIPCTVGRS